MSKSLGGLVDGAENGLRQLGCGAFCGEEDGAEEEAGRRSHGGNVVGIDVDRVPANLVAGKSDGVGLGHEQAVAAVDDRCVLAHGRWHEQAFVAVGIGREQTA